MTLDELQDQLRALIDHGDPVEDHSTADRLLLEYIGDDEVTKAFERIDKFYE